MPNDVFYGADCELRIGVMADKDTMPTVWQKIEFNSLTITPSQTLVQRPRLGAARANSLDGLKSRRGLERVAADLTVDGDTYTLPLLLRCALGAPTSTQEGVTSIYDHVWAPGAKSEIYFALAVRAGAEKVHVLKAAALSALSTQFGGENVQDFDVQMTLKAISRSRDADWPAGTVTALPTPAPILRGQLLVNAAAADQTTSASFTYDRNLLDDAYLATSTPATKTVSYLRPGPQPVHTGRATVRAFGSAYDDLADAGDTLAAELRLLGVTTDHMVKLAHANAELEQPPLQVGEGVIERTFNWRGFQASAAGAVAITVVNDVDAYA